MKKHCFTAIFLFLTAAALFAGDHTQIRMKGLKPAIVIDDEVLISKKGRSVFIALEDYESEQVQISRDYELMIDGKRIDTDETQDELIKEYYDLSMEIMSEVRKMGLEGAKIGMSGAMVGVKAVVGVARMLLPNYSSEDFEYDMEQAGEALERKAEVLEVKGEWIEEQVLNLESIHNQLAILTPELRELNWF